MKNTFAKDEQLFTKKGNPTNLFYIDEAGYVGKSIRQVLVRCACGTEVIKPLASIRAGASNSCGKKGCKLRTSPLLKKIYSVGENVTDCFTYQGEDLEKSTSNHRHILVKCSCGEPSSIRIDAVKRNVCCKNCGRAKRRATFYDKHKLALQRSVYGTYKRQAANRGYEFKITFEQFLLLIDQSCHYCDNPPSNRYKSNGRDLFYNGLDRTVNSKGYTLDNVVPCCGSCNIMKNKFDRKDFLSHLRKIFNNQNF